MRCPSSGEPAESRESDLHKRELFATTIPVMVNHLNYGNHLGYDSVLSICQEARMRWLKGHGMTEISLEDSIGYMITDVAMNYRGEGFFGDQLSVKLYADSHSRRGFTLRYEIVNQSTDKVIALGETRHVFFDFQSRRVATSPDKFRELFAGDEPRLPPVR